MRYRRFGQTAASLSVFSLGTMRALASPDNLQQVVAAAWERGINHFETARSYGPSELYLGRALQALQLPRDRYFLTTKLLPTGEAPRLAAELAAARERLQCHRLDFLALHGINTWEHLEAVRQPQVQAVLDRARADGHVGHVGFSTHAPLEVVLGAIDTGLFAFVNLHYYYFDRRLAAAIARAAARDMGIFIISPADKGGRLYTPPAKLQELCAPFSPLALTYRFLLADRRITTLSVGPASPAELDAPLQVSDRDGPLDAAEGAALARLEAELATQLGETYCQQCQRCLPCPEAIDIPAMLRLRNLAVGLDMQQYGEYRYGMFERAGHWFPGRRGDRCTDCGDCLPRCPHQLEIPALLRETHARLQGPPRRRLWDEPAG